MAADDCGFITGQNVAVASCAIAFCPELIITEAQIDELIEKQGKALNDVLIQVKKEGLLK